MMEKANELALKAYVKADVARTKAKQEVTELANNEMGVSGIVVSLILIAIAVALAIIFRDSIAKFMQTIFKGLPDPNTTPDPTNGYGK